MRLPAQAEEIAIPPCEIDEDDTAESELLCWFCGETFSEESEFTTHLENIPHADV